MARLFAFCINLSIAVLASLLDINYLNATLSFSGL
nr:MAG TPA: hypothetical protein [Caudoviricetes sp.]